MSFDPGIKHPTCLATPETVDDDIYIYKYISENDIINLLGNIYEIMVSSIRQNEGVLVASRLTFQTATLQ